MKLRKAAIWCVGLGAAICLLTWPPLLDGTQNLLLPGTESRSLDTLKRGTRVRVQATLDDLHEQGWPAWVRATSRNAERQAFYKRVGWSKTDKSKHQRGLAADINLAVPWVFFPLHIYF